MTTEAEVLQSLGLNSNQQNAILSGQARLLILDASAHMDWDWLLPYPVLLMGGSSERAAWYFHTDVGPVVDILGDANGLLTKDAGYRYSICETGFLRGFALARPTTFAAIAADSTTVKIAGGGITSPDNLLPHGEAFIRNYLVGHVWLAANAPGLPVPLTVWVPDDFGHDPELPVLAQAMGMIAAGFERIPGGGYGGDPLTPLDPSVQSLAAQIEAANKIDFVWTAKDGSAMVGHWLIGGYGQGNGIVNASSIQSYLDKNFTPSPTPYIYVPVLSDFSLPNPALMPAINDWNDDGGAYGGTTVIATAASFEDYAQLVAFHGSEMQASYGAEFNANPFFTGCYGSRPELKIRHQRAARNLMAAEVFSVIAGFVEPQGGTSASGTGATAAQNLFEGWNLLSPSTHHDYITGTAIPDVFHSEQTTLLRQADATARWLLDDAMQTVAGAIAASGSGTPFAIFNALGFQRSGVVELSADQVADVNLTVSGDGFQSTAEGGLLFAASAPSLGYQTAYLQSAAAPTNPATVTPTTIDSTTASVTLSNGLVTAVLTPDANGIWGLTSVVDVATNAELIASGQVANDLQFWADGGDEYQFGNEVNPPDWTLTTVKLTNPTISIIEAGQLRVTVRTTVSYSDSHGTIEFIRDYILLANEPMLRFRSSGAAPMLAAGAYHGSTVVVTFPLTGAIDTLTRGTPYHWTGVMPAIYWNDQTFFATHNFVIPQSAGTSLCAIYHADIPGWGLSYQWNASSKSFDPNNGVLYGSLWRNGDAHYYGWVDDYQRLVRGSDPEVHVREYALRMPSTLGAAATGQPLREALAFASPLRGVAVAPWTGALPDNLSLASASGDVALITVAKPGTVTSGDVVLRVYQPSNEPLAVDVTLDSHFGTFTARGQTALEQDLGAAAESALGLTTTSSTISFTASYALTTLAVTPSS